MTVEEEQAVTAAPAEGQEIAQQDGAVTSEDQGEGFLVEELGDAVGEGDGVIGDGLGVEEEGFGVAVGIERRRFEATGVGGLQ
ncbi:MAG: hypothetical protein ACK5AZ_25010 [Bryobacteraceae bacterium]